MKDPKEQTDKVLHPPYTGERGELYEILWKYASGGGGEESRIPCDEIDNIITDILKLQNSKCHCGGYPDCICNSVQNNQNIVNEAMDLASKKCGKKDKSIYTCTCDQPRIVNSMKTGKPHCSKCHKNINQSELAMQPKTAEDICSCDIPYFPTGDTTHCSKCNKITIY